MHITPIQIRFNDVDQMGHVNNAVLMEYLDLGKDSFFSAHGLSPLKGDFTVMVVHCEVDFRAQVRYHDRIHVATELQRLGHKSVTLLQRVVNSDTDTTCVECLTVLSGYRRSTAASAPIPDEVRQWLQR